MSGVAPIPLGELNGKLRPYTEYGITYGSVWFDCPQCKSEYCWAVVPYSPKGGRTCGGRPIWTHVSGDTLETLTLSPSYLQVSVKPSGCKLHGFVRNGCWVSC